MNTISSPFQILSKLSNNYWGFFTGRKQFKLWRALAGVGAFRVNADAVLARLRVLTLIHVSAVPTGLVQGVAAVAHAPDIVIFHHWFLF